MLAQPFRKSWLSHCVGPKSEDFSLKLRSLVKSNFSQVKFNVAFKNADNNLKFFFLLKIKGKRLKNIHKWFINLNVVLVKQVTLGKLKEF